LDPGPPKAPAGQGKIEKLVAVLGSIPSAHPEVVEKIRIEALQ
jgi:hypothetical protein